ncbi:MAG: sulfotransferase domain-containing protein [Candidatus Delongbacteria bacterium]|nr:sulfotransferase domain-containing protein [Candidatus Delongbacteria bacterium]
MELLVISAGMPKSGSAYIYNIINQLMIQSGMSDGGDIKERFHLEMLLKGTNNRIDINCRKIDMVRLWLISLMYKSFAVKTHLHPDRIPKWMIRLGLIKIIYIYRDPRDVLVSAMDRGKKEIAGNREGYFTRCVDFDAALLEVKRWIQNGQAYLKLNKALIVRYEELHDHPEVCLQRIAAFLRLRVSPLVAPKILYQFSADNPEVPGGKLNLNQARIGRYKDALSAEQQKVLMEVLGTSIRELGYGTG